MEFECAAYPCIDSGPPGGRTDVHKLMEDMVTQTHITCHYKPGVYNRTYIVTASSSIHTKYQVYLAFTIFGAVIDCVLLILLCMYVHQGRFKLEGWSKIDRDY